MQLKDLVCEKWSCIFQIRISCVKTGYYISAASEFYRDPQRLNDTLPGISYGKTHECTVLKWQNLTSDFQFMSFLTFFYGQQHIMWVLTHIWNIFHKIIIIFSFLLFLVECDCSENHWLSSSFSTVWNEQLKKNLQWLDVFLIIALQNVANLFGNSYSINIPATLLLAKQRPLLQSCF